VIFDEKQEATQQLKPKQKSMSDFM
jgi:hypothetical protein